MPADHEFQVKFEGVHLSDQALKRIQSGIHQLVINELAGIDEEGDLVVTRPIKLRPIINGIVARIAEGKIQIAGLKG